MAATICPAILAENPHLYREQMERVEPFASRVHVDVADGVFAPNRTVGFDRVWWSGNRTIDLHVMYLRPFEHTEIMLALAPRLIIVHAEAEGNFLSFANLMRRHGIEAGVALLPRTSVSDIAPAIGLIDHALIFSGDLSHFGGEADLNLLAKAKQLRALKPTVEIGWDGGVNDKNARALAEGGVDVLNVGGFIEKSGDPNEAYAKLKTALEN